MIWLAWLVLAFLAMRLAVVVTNLLTRQWIREATPRRNALVSVLIPARNEEKTLPLLLQRLAQQDLAPYEILVYDDLSEDDTWGIIEKYQEQLPNLRGIRGQALPSGWLGKNHACHQLALQAKGQFLLFMDADVLPQPALIKSALAMMEKHDLQLLSLFPTQVMQTPGEKLIVPLMNWVLLSLLPLWLIMNSKKPAFSAANGQFMMFWETSYRNHQWHQKLRGQKAEDILIARSMKQEKYKVHTMLGGQLIHCRMYPGFRASMNGFSKNVLEFFGGSLWVGPLFVLITTLGFIPVWYAMGIAGLLVYVFMVMAIRWLVALGSCQPIRQNLLFWPAHQFTFVWLMVAALRNRQFRRNSWKGRNIDIMSDKK